MTMIKKNSGHALHMKLMLSATLLEQAMEWHCDNYNHDDPNDYNDDHDKYYNHAFRRMKLRAQLGFSRRCNGRVGGETLATELDLLILILTI